MEEWRSGGVEEWRSGVISITLCTIIASLSESLQEELNVFKETKSLNQVNYVCEEHRKVRRAGCRCAAKQLEMFFAISTSEGSV